jgi:hypothetical protein
MEVMISAAVLMVLVLGTLAAVDAVTGTAGANKARTIAAALAEKDQEELRGLRTVELDRLNSLIPAPRKVKVGNVEYTVTSNAEWVTDVGGSNISCSVGDGEGTYLRIKSTVTSNISEAKVKPVVVSSIVAPQPGSGQLAARVTNAAGQPVTSLPVEAIGPTPKTRTTNAGGCAVFGAVDSGSYQIKLNTTGWVDPDGNVLVLKDTSVEAGSLSLVELVYDRAATLTVNLQTKNGTNPAVADDSFGIVADHTGISTGQRVFPETGTMPTSAAASITLTNLFPFTSPYKIYSGRSSDHDPFGFVPTYFETATAAAPQFAPGETRTINILEPYANLTFFRSSAARSNAQVYATSSGDNPVTFDMGLTGTDGKPVKQGLPFGDYSICAEYRNGSGVWFHGNGTLANTSAAGAAAQTITIPNSPSGGNGRC